MFVVAMFDDQEKKQQKNLQLFHTQQQTIVLLHREKKYIFD